MEINNENIVLMIAMYKRDLEVVKLNNTQFQNKKKYSATMIIVVQLLKQNIIEKEEYKEIEEHFREMYKINHPLFTNIELAEQ